MHFPDRVYGIENEYGVVRIFSDKTFGSIDPQQGRKGFNVALKSIPRSIFTYGMGQQRLWHSNGGCTYLDLGEHPEHATPECRRIRDAVKYNKAGELLIATVFDMPMSENGKLLLYKNTAGIDEQGNICGQFGCHENYLTYTDSLMNHINNYALIPFLITRQIFDGAGWWMRDGTFCFSQRALDIKCESSSDTTSNRPIINIKHSPDTGPLHRLHLILGDANILEFAIYLKIGATALMLNLMEGKRIPGLRCKNAVETIHAISTYYDPFEPLVNLSRDKKSPFDVQTIYLEAAQRELTTGSFASEETEAELKHVALCWEQALNAIYNRDTKWMLGKIDHVTKRYLGEQAIRQRLDSMIDNKQPLTFDLSKKIFLLKSIDILYHGITYRSLQDRMNAAWPHGRLLNDNEIHEAVNSPPANTRAWCRSAYINFLCEHNIKNPGPIDWSSMKETLATKGSVFQCPNPLQWNNQDFDFFMQTLQEKHAVYRNKNSQNPL